MLAGGSAVFLGCTPLQSVACLGILVIHCFLLQCSLVPRSFSGNETQVSSRCTETRCTNLLIGRNNSLLLVYLLNQCLFGDNVLIYCYAELPTYNNKTESARGHCVFKWHRFFCTSPVPIQEEPRAYFVPENYGFLLNACSGTPLLRKPAELVMLMVLKRGELLGYNYRWWLKVNKQNTKVTRGAELIPMKAVAK